MYGVGESCQKYTFNNISYILTFSLYKYQCFFTLFRITTAFNKYRKKKYNNKIIIIIPRGVIIFLFKESRDFIANLYFFKTYLYYLYFPKYEYHFNKISIFLI